ncbi:hypothetical protein FIV42_19195 [Persicimonas caeni]|uniref:Leucine-binding protein domain-containing protein n=1 Tax=Persicimonas caeni TaxID=2292766 RepID=A0A4Y6PWT0_PERCE|nr:ABC transporter substrate-binding protein [Persicimonas caeni]QDG52791.1 hypothetical protein FIV42_19195 [Persicimonas caeni]QED34013.1 ABC transporter substrate-binding protein [Persicimonas caeni]
MSRSKSFLILVALSLVASSTGACTFLVDVDECASESDCVSNYGRGWTCGGENLCERREIVDELDQGPCDGSAGPVEDPNTFNIGVLLPLSGEEGGDGTAMLDAIKLAQANFNDLAGVDNRQIGLVICDTEGKDAVALEGADHLVNDAGIEAIIGPNFSSQTVDVATQYAIPNDVLLVSPSATAVPISDLDDKNLVWRTTPSDALQAHAMGLLVSDVLDGLAADDPDVVKLAILARQDDVYAQGLRESLVQYLPDEVINGGEHRLQILNYQNTSAGQGSDYSGVVAEVTTKSVKPDVVVILGFAEAWQISRQLDSELDADTIYIFADAGRVAEEANDAASDPLEGRVMGTAPGSASSSSYVPWQSFKSAYQATYQQNPADIQYVANAYDALYAIGLAAAGSGFTGPELAQGMAKLSDGETINATQSDLSRGLTTRAGGSSIDLQGASGELDWNDNGDPTVGEVSFWCLRNRAVPDQGVLYDRQGNFTNVGCAEDSCEVDTDCPESHVCGSNGTCDPSN